MIKKLLIFIPLTLALLFVTWYLCIALDEEPISQSALLEKYQYQPNSQLQLKLKENGPRAYLFSYTSFDGEIVNGKISYPDQIAESYPVLVGIHAMGRSYPRWWLDSLKGRPTVTQVNKITKLANQSGQVVIAIDARYHGSRKIRDRPLRSIMNDLHLFGDKSYYEEMIRYTVLDHRVLLDWVEAQENLNINQLTVAGYSMGGQISLLLGAVDKRVNTIVSIVPPFIDDKTALVAPKNISSLLTDQSILLITANADENASKEENKTFFTSIPSSNKHHITFAGGHILPENYVGSLVGWL